MRKPAIFLLFLISNLALVTQAETRVTYKSAKSTSSYYQMAVQVAEAVKSHSKGELVLTVEESQGSVQNVKEARKRDGNYAFTTPPTLVKRAVEGVKPFEGETGYDGVRSLFVIPSLTMHFVVRRDSGVTSFADLEGKDFIIGKGSFGARQAAYIFDAFGLGGKVNLIDVELNAAVPALKNGKVDGFATAGSYPAPNVIEAATSTDILLLSMTEEQLPLAKGTPLNIPGGTYPGVEEDTRTISLPVGAYATTGMDDDTAYRLTLGFWQSKAEMGKNNPWWNGVGPELLGTLGVPLHPGALRAYEELDIRVPDTLR